MANAGKPNVRMIRGDHIGITSLSCYSDVAGILQTFAEPHPGRKPASFSWTRCRRSYSKGSPAHDQLS